MLDLKFAYNALVYHEGVSDQDDSPLGTIVFASDNPYWWACAIQLESAGIATYRLLLWDEEDPDHPQIKLEWTGKELSVYQVNKEIENEVC